MLGADCAGVSTAINPPHIQASDHDDGEIDSRSRALSLTDLNVFREQDQNPGAGSDDVILVMNTNPRSLARQQYYFSSNARYEIKISRVANVNEVPTAVPDLTLRFTFSPPARNNQQRFTLTLVDRNGRETAVSRASGRPLLTTSLTGTPVVMLRVVPVANQFLMKSMHDVILRT